MTDAPIRMSGPTLKVLRLFLEKPREQLSGAQISKQTGIGSGTLYPLLMRLESANWMTSEWEVIDPREAGRPRRRNYKLTGFGQQMAQTELRGLQMPTEALAWNI